jgi:hypothetical protein
MQIHICIYVQLYTHLFTNINAYLLIDICLYTHTHIYVGGTVDIARTMLNYSLQIYQIDPIYMHTFVCVYFFLYIHTYLYMNIFMKVVLLI